MKKVEVAKWEAQRPSDRPASRHSEEMSALERERFTLAKSINDLEGVIVQYESMLAAQKSTFTAIQNDNAKHVKGGDISRLEVEWNFFRELGIEWITEENEIIAPEGVVKCRITDQKRNDIFSTILDDSKQNPVEQANLLWNFCCPQTQ